MIILETCIVTHYVEKVSRPWWRWRPWGAWQNVKKRIEIYKTIPSNGPGDLVEKATRITHDGQTFDVESWEYDFDGEVWRAWCEPETIMRWFDDLELHEAEQIRDDLLSTKYGSWQQGQHKLAPGDSYRALESA